MQARKHVDYALSIKQPWAALIVHGLKTVEIRRWTTRRRGRVLIHAAKIADERVHGLSLVAPEIEATTESKGGIIGAVELVDCISYCDIDMFREDKDRHYNDPAWFEPPLLYGFVFEKPELLPFRPLAGNVRFFSVPSE